MRGMPWERRGRKRPTMRKVIEMEGKDTIIVRLPNPRSESSIWRARWCQTWVGFVAVYPREASLAGGSSETPGDHCPQTQPPACHFVNTVALIAGHWWDFLGVTVIITLQPLLLTHAFLSMDLSAVYVVVVHCHEVTRLHVNKTAMGRPVGFPSPPGIKKH